MAAGATAAAARRLRRLYDMEAVGFAAAALLLDCPHPDVLATARPQITQGTRAVTTALGAPLTVPEHARGLLRAWVGKASRLLQWADDVAATYLTLRLEIAEPCVSG